MTKETISLKEIFPQTTEEQWRDAALKALRGEPFDVLCTDTLEGLELQPLYGPEQLTDLEHVGGLPGQAPYARGTSAAGASRVCWEIRADLALPRTSHFRDAAAEELAGGASGLGVVLDRAGRAGLDLDEDDAEGLVGQGGLPVACWQDLALALDGVDLHQTPLTLQAGTAALPAGALLFAMARERGLSPDLLRGAVAADPLGQLAVSGALPTSLDTALDELADLVSWCASNAPDMAAVVIDAAPYHDGGGSAVHELGFAMATAAEYMTALTDRGLDPDDAAAHVSFSFAAGTRLLAEVSKLRAARLLWSQVAAAFGCSESAGAMKLHVRTSRWNKARREGHNNLLRATMEAFAATVAGADAISVAPYDEAWTSGDATSRRLARNVQVLLREETGLGHVVDPAGGSYAVETFTDALARKAWALLQEVERRGGMGAALQEGFPQQEVAGLAATRAVKIADGAEPLVGVNRYAREDAKLPKPPLEDMAGARFKRAAALTNHRQGRDEAALEQVRVALTAALEGAPGGRTAAAVDAACAGMTLGELCAALRTDAGPPTSVTPLPAQTVEQLFDAAPAEGCAA